VDWGSEIRAWGMSWSRQTLIKQDSSGVIGGESALEVEGEQRCRECGGEVGKVGECR
jgi:hypothetical protein